MFLSYTIYRQHLETYYNTSYPSFLYYIAKAVYNIKCK